MQRVPWGSPSGGFDITGWFLCTRRVRRHDVTTALRPAGRDEDEYVGQEQIKDGAAEVAIDKPGRPVRQIGKPLHSTASVGRAWVGSIQATASTCWDLSGIPHGRAQGLHPFPT